MPERLDLVKGAPALRRAHLDQVWPRSGRRAPRPGLNTRARWPSATRCWGGSARAERALELLDTWDLELARHGIEVMEARRAALAELRGAVRAAWRRSSGFPAIRALQYRPRSKAADAGELRAELAERRDDDLERGFTDARAAPRRPSCSRATAARCAPTAPRASSARACSRSCSPSARPLAAIGRPPLMLLDDVMSELDAVAARAPRGAGARRWPGGRDGDGARARARRARRRRGAR